MYRNHFPAYKEELPTYLHEWVDIATRGLASWEKPRVRAEIEAHIQEAVEEAVAKGAEADTAKRRALHALGSPRQANKAYLRSRSPMHVEHALINLKRSPFLFNYTQTNVWSHVFSVTGLLVLMAFIGLVLSFFEPIFCVLFCIAILALGHRIYVYNYLFPELMKTNDIKKIFQHLQYSETLKWLPFFSFGALENPLFILIPLTFGAIGLSVCHFGGRKIPVDLQWSDIRLD